MAEAPCSICGKGYRKAAVHVYPALSTGGEIIREHLRLCPACSVAFQKMTADRFFDTDSEDLVDDELRCFVCEGEMGLTERYRVAWVTSYFKKDERRNWNAVSHTGCLGGARARLGLPAE